MDGGRRVGLTRSQSAQSVLFTSRAHLSLSEPKPLLDAPLVAIQF